MGITRDKLKIIVEKTDTREGKLFDVFIQSCILISLVGFSIETLPDLDPSSHRILRVTEVLLVMIFTVEYALRVYVSDSKSGFIFSFFGIIDILAILPFYLTTGLDLRSIRILRVLRVFRIFKMVRYSAAINRFAVAIRLVKEELLLFYVVTSMLIFIAAVGIYHCEHAAQPEVFSSVFASLWWAVITLATVGYGDMYPITAGGRFFTFLILMLGLGIVAVPTGILASALSKAREWDNRGGSEG